MGDIFFDSPAIDKPVGAGELSVSMRLVPSACLPRLWPLPHGRGSDNSDGSDDPDG